MTHKINVGILGATGIVGQRFSFLLESHAQFRVTVLGASSRSKALCYGEISWKIEGECPERLTSMKLVSCVPEEFKHCKIVFSALESSVAADIENKFRQAGFPVFSNARAYRDDTDVPLIVPSVNETHIDLVKQQPSYKSPTGGFIVTNANCVTTGLCVVLNAINEKLPIARAVVVSMQAASGAGYPGTSFLDLTGNVIPFIPGPSEEERVEAEPKKILGSLVDGKIIPAKFDISAMCNRVPVIDGHLLSLSIGFNNLEGPTQSREFLPIVEDALRNYKPMLDLPSFPKTLIELHTNAFRPQPRLDCSLEKAMTVSVGRVRLCPAINGVKLTVLSHNTVLGAAGSSILNAELAVVKGYVK